MIPPDEALFEKGNSKEGLSVSDKSKGGLFVSGKSKWSQVNQNGASLYQVKYPIGLRRFLDLSYLSYLS
jgi:hypothetical protein